MRVRPLLSVLCAGLITIGVANVRAETNSYFAKTYPFTNLKTGGFPTPIQRSSSMSSMRGRTS